MVRIKNKKEGLVCDVLEEFVAAKNRLIMEDDLQLVYNHNFFILQLGDKGIEFTKAEAEKLFVDLGHALQDLHKRQEETCPRTSYLEETTKHFKKG